MDIPWDLARCLAHVDQLAEMEVPSDTSSNSSPRGDDSMDDDMDDDSRFCRDSSDAGEEEWEHVQRSLCAPPLHRAQEEVMNIPADLEEEDSDVPENAPCEASSLWRPGSIPSSSKVALRVATYCSILSCALKAPSSCHHLHHHRIWQHPQFKYASGRDRTAKETRS